MLPTFGTPRIPDLGKHDREAYLTIEKPLGRARAELIQDRVQLARRLDHDHWLQT